MKPLFQSQSSSNSFSALEPIPDVENLGLPSFGRLKTYKSHPKKQIPRIRSAVRRFSFRKWICFSSRWSEEKKLFAETRVGVDKKEKKRLSLRKFLSRMALSIHLILPIIFSSYSRIEACSGRFVNPITDICWSCLFPISIGSSKSKWRRTEDTPNPGQIPAVGVQDLLFQG